MNGHGHVRGTGTNEDRTIRDDATTLPPDHPDHPDFARNALLRALPPGSTLYALVRRRSRSTDTAYVSFFTIEKGDDRPSHLTNLIAAEAFLGTGRVGGKDVLTIDSRNYGEDASGLTRWISRRLHNSSDAIRHEAF